MNKAALELIKQSEEEKFINLQLEKQEINNQRNLNLIIPKEKQTKKPNDLHNSSVNIFFVILLILSLFEIALMFFIYLLSKDSFPVRSKVDIITKFSEYEIINDLIFLFLLIPTNLLSLVSILFTIKLFLWLIEFFNAICFLLIIANIFKEIISALALKFDPFSIFLLLCYLGYKFYMMKNIYMIAQNM